MNAKELINQIDQTHSNNWKNSYIDIEIQILLELIALHYKVCQDCRESFDDMEYDQTTLKEMEPIFQENNNLDLWIC